MPLIAQKLVEIAGIEQTTMVAHGCVRAARSARRHRGADAERQPSRSIAPPSGDRRRRRDGHMAPLAVSRAECPREPAFVDIDLRSAGRRPRSTASRCRLVDLVDSLESSLARAHGVGGVEPFETPAAVVLHAAHHRPRAIDSAGRAIEWRIVSRALRGYHRSRRRGSRMRDALDAYVDIAQEPVAGIVRLKLFKARACEIVDDAKPHARRKTR